MSGFEYGPIATYALTRLAWELEDQAAERASGAHPDETPAPEAMVSRYPRPSRPGRQRVRGDVRSLHAAQ